MSVVLDASIREEMQTNYLNYAMYVIKDRALPDIRDGLKPVHRRIMYAMYDGGMTSSKAYKKSARMVGDVIGKFHPHGDTAVYEASVKMAQPFSMNVPLVDGQGNFGSIDGDSPAAMRYTEQRLSKISNEFFRGIRKETIEWKDNYDGHEQEPVVLPVAFPSFVVNGTSGIAVGMASEMPPHNISEVIDCTLALFKDSDMTTPEIMEIMKAPDFPTKAIVSGSDGFASAIETGRGRITMRSRHEIQPRKGGGESLIITEIPYKVNKAKLIERIAELVKNKAVTDVVGLRDESKDDVRIVIDIKSSGSAEVIYSQLLKMTDLQKNISYNIMAIKDGRPVQTGIKDALLSWMTFRQETLRREYIFDRKKAMARLHILEGLLKAMDHLDEVIKKIRTSKTRHDARDGLIALLSIDEIQANAILDLKLHRLTNMELDEIKDEFKDVSDFVELMTLKIDTPEEIVKDIEEQLIKIKSEHGHERRTEVGEAFDEITREDLIEKEDVYITLSEKGYVKRMPLNVLSAQNRGTRGKRSMELGEEDGVRNLYQLNTHDTILVFDGNGQVYGVKGYNIPEAKLTDKGRHIRNVIDGFDEEIHAMLSVKESDPDTRVLTVTSQAQVKKSKLDVYKNSTRKGGILGVGINEGDSLVSSMTCTDRDHIVLVSSEGRAVRFSAADVSTVGRTASGVRGMKLPEGARIVGAFVIKDGIDDLGTEMLCISENGLGKRTPVSGFPVKGRAGKGMIAYKMSDRTGALVKALDVKADEEILMFASNGVSNKIRVEDVSQQGRSTSGSKMINLDEGAKVVTVVTSPKSMDEALDEMKDS